METKEVESAKRDPKWLVAFKKLSYLFYKYRAIEEIAKNDSVLQELYDEFLAAREQIVCQRRKNVRRKKSYRALQAAAEKWRRLAEKHFAQRKSDVGSLQLKSEVLRSKLEMIYLAALHVDNGNMEASSFIREVKRELELVLGVKPIFPEEEKTEEALNESANV